MTRVTGPDCAVMSNLINYIHTHTHRHVIMHTLLSDWVLNGEGGMMTSPLQYVARFDGGGEIVGFGRGGYKESWPSRSLFVEFPFLFVARAARN